MSAEYKEVQRNKDDFELALHSIKVMNILSDVERLDNLVQNWIDFNFVQGSVYYEILDGFVILTDRTGSIMRIPLQNILFPRLEGLNI